MVTVILQSSDDYDYEVDERVARMSDLIRNFFEDLGEAEEGTVVPLPEVDHVILEKVIQFMNEHINDPIDQPAQPVDYISEVDRAIIGIRTDNSVINRNELYALIRAANYLSISSLLQVTTRAAANMLRGKSVEQMRVVLGIRT